MSVRSALLVAGLAIALFSGCARKVPQEVIDVNRSLGEAKDACAGVYAKERLQGVASRVDSMNRLADDRKYRKAKKEALPILPTIDGVKDEASGARAAAKQKAEAALAEAEAGLAAANSAEAGRYAAADLGSAQAKLEEARSAFKDPCRYGEAEMLARGAAGLASAAADAAVAEKQRLEEEQRRAEEERRRQEELARRREEEERLKRFPPTYTVEKGDSLWRIAGMETIYGNPSYWPVLHDANGDQIQDPDLIYPGQQLTIPRGLSPEQMDEKLRVLWGRYPAIGSAED